MVLSHCKFVTSFIGYEPLNVWRCYVNVDINCLNLGLTVCLTFWVDGMKTCQCASITLMNTYIVRMQQHSQGSIKTFICKSSAIMSRSNTDAKHSYGLPAPNHEISEHTTNGTKVAVDSVLLSNTNTWQQVWSVDFYVGLVKLCNACLAALWLNYPFTWISNLLAVICPKCDLPV